MFQVEIDQNKDPRRGTGPTSGIFRGIDPPTLHFLRLALEILGGGIHGSLFLSAPDTFDQSCFSPKYKTSANIGLCQVKTSTAQHATEGSDSVARSVRGFLCTPRSRSDFAPGAVV